MMTTPDSSILGSTVSINDDVLFQELTGEGVLLNLKTGVYLGLNQVGTRIWQLFEDRPVLSRIVDSIVTEFDVEREQCAMDLVALVNEMTEHDLVTLTPPDSP